MEGTIIGASSMFSHWAFQRVWGLPENRALKPHTVRADGTSKVKNTPKASQKILQAGFPGRLADRRVLEQLG